MAADLRWDEHRAQASAVERTAPDNFHAPGHTTKKHTYFRLNTHETIGAIVATYAERRLGEAVKGQPRKAQFPIAVTDL